MAGTSDMVSGAYSYPGPPLTTQRLIIAGNVLLESKLQDIWGGGDGQPLPSAKWPWMLVNQEHIAAGMVPVQILISKSEPPPETATTQYSWLTVVFNFGASLCTSNQTGGCTNLPQ